jgi:hypothetical protein
VTLPFPILVIEVGGRVVFKKAIFAALPHLPCGLAPAVSRPGRRHDDDHAIANVNLNLVGEACLFDERLRQPDAS